MHRIRHVLRLVSILLATLALVAAVRAGTANAFTQQEFRRLATYDGFSGTACVGSPAGLSGDYSFWAGLLPAEASAQGWTGTQGYGNGWYVAIAKSFYYNGTGTVQVGYNFASDLEPNKDFAKVAVDLTGNGSACGVVAETYTGTHVAGSGVVVLDPSAVPPTMRSTAGTYTIYFLVTSDEAGSDEDGGYSSSCGAFAVDDISVVGGGNNSLDDFEASADGWVPVPCLVSPDCKMSQVNFDCTNGTLSATQDPVTVGPGDYLAWLPGAASPCATACGAATFEITFPPDANLFPSGYTTGKIDINDVACQILIPTAATAGTYKYDITVYDNTGTVCSALSPNPLDPYIVVAGGAAVPGLRTKATLLLLLIMTGAAAWALRRRAAEA